MVWRCVLFGLLSLGVVVVTLGATLGVAAWRVYGGGL